MKVQIIRNGIYSEIVEELQFGINMLYSKLQVSPLRVGAGCIYGQDVQREGFQPGFKQEIHWLEDGERSLADAHWSEDKFL